MRHSSPFIAGLALGLVVLSGTTAVAAPFDPDTESIRIEPFTWQFASSPFGVGSASYSAGGTTYSDAWDSSVLSVWSEDENNEATSVPTEFACSSPDLDGSDLSGDVIVSCDAITSTVGLVVDGEARLYAEGDLVRMLYVISNPSAAAISFSYSYAVDFYGGLSHRASSTAPALAIGTVLTADDVWVYNAQPASLNSLVAWGLPSAGAGVERVREWDTSTVLLVNDRDVDGEQIAVEPGQALALAFFHKVDPVGTTASRSEFTDVSAGADAGAALEPASVSSSEAIATATDEFSTFEGRLSEGIAKDLFVANWQPLPIDADGSPELADTGSDSGVVTVALGTGAVLLALGLLMLVWRRVRRTGARS